MSDEQAPGLKISYRRDGSKKAHWVAANCSRQAKGYPIKTVTLTHLPEEKWPGECRRHYADLLKWIAGDGRSEKPKLIWTDTINSLIDHFEKHELSPYREVKYNSRETYDDCHRVLRSHVGERRVSRLQGVDFIRWEENLKAPAKPDGPFRVDRSYKAMSHLRRLIRWGVVLALPHCKRLLDIIKEMEFEQPPERDAFMTYDQCVAIIAAAHEIGRPSIALGQALQFDLMLRQKDVIGEWIFDTSGTTGIRHTAPNSLKPKRWENGLLWSHISPDLVLSKVVEKTKRKSRVKAQFDLKGYPLVYAEIMRVPEERRVGPVVINEYTGLPYTDDTYRELWRQAADLGGVPRDIQNRDSRSGGITEATDALPVQENGLELIRHSSTHKNIKTTARYSKNTLAKTSKVAQLRVASRRKPQE